MLQKYMKKKKNLKKIIKSFRALYLSSHFIFLIATFFGFNFLYVLLNTQLVKCYPSIPLCFIYFFLYLSLSLFCMLIIITLIPIFHEIFLQIFSQSKYDTLKKYKFFIDKLCMINFLIFRHANSVNNIFFRRMLVLRN